MHFVFCRFLRILEDMSFSSFLRILILLEEPRHVTADLYVLHIFYRVLDYLVHKCASSRFHICIDSLIDVYK